MLLKLGDLQDPKLEVLSIFLAIFCGDQLVISLMVDIDV
jgi:hypothetical protein